LNKDLSRLNNSIDSSNSWGVNKTSGKLMKSKMNNFYYTKIMTTISSSNCSNRLSRDFKIKFKRLNVNHQRILEIRITHATTSLSHPILLSMGKPIIMNIAVKMIYPIKIIFNSKIKNILWIFRSNNNIKLIQN
jgi:hypothetical protein